MVIRYALLTSHYAKDRMWSDEVLKSAERRVEAIRSALSRNEVAPTQDVLIAIAKAISNDLDTPLALDLIDSWVASTSAGETGGSVGELSRFLDATLGLAL
jgi:L-cysteine:1D-myo-inositol 2-amino-2-deoxy-alpha-D-glucopyranoside ligase